jgi:enamine deaminase RidA (YjgF/YER057c/UK114 family)
MTKKFINPPGLKPLGMYTQATVVQGGSIAFISGQVSVDAQGKVVGAGNMQAQAAQVFENLKLALSGVGATFEDVVKFTIFIVGLTQEKRKAVMEVRSRYISHKNPPAATMIGVDKLVEPELLLEIEAVVAIN